MDTFTELPEDAIIRYQVPTWQARPDQWDGQYLKPFKSEEDARRYAASGDSNGSGQIKKRVWFYHRYDDGILTGTGEYKLECELEPVTEFTEAGMKRREKFLEIINCTHESTVTHKGGAGCQTWYDTHCRKCGRWLSGG